MKPTQNEESKRLMHLEMESMNRFRNPKFAPEALERKLSPSSYLAYPASIFPGATAQYGTAKQTLSMNPSGTIAYDVPKDLPPPPPVAPVR
jgi:hypothetical protein